MHIDGKTKIYGVIGYPVKHTFSPLMHNAAFENLRINGAYLPFEVKPKELRSILHCMKSLGVQGLNVTIPHKEKVMPYLDKVDKEASLIKAVNTIVNEDGRLKGFNTDGKGFISSLEEAGLSIGGKKFFIMGAGGASRAICFSLALKDAGRIIVVDKIAEKASKLASSLTRNSSCEAIALRSDIKAIKALLLDSDVLVNATPCGMQADDPCLVNSEVLHKKLFVYDLIYNPPVTRLLRDAKNAGARVSNGTGMLLHQGAISFNLWTGRKAPVNAMRKALAKALKTV